MKKALLASLLMATIGFASAQSSVSLYGVLDQSYYGLSNSTGANTQLQNGINSSGASTSRFGLQGSEDLGGGLKAGFNLESQLTLSSGAVGSSNTGAAQTTTGTSEVFNRASNVSLSSKQFGDVTIGRLTTPINGAIASVDALGINSLGLTNYFVYGSALYGSNLVTGLAAGSNIGGASSASAIPDLFASGIGYKTPAYHGVTGSIFTSPGSGNTTSNNAGAIREALVNFNGEGALKGLNVQAATGTVANSLGAVSLTRTLLGVNYTWDKYKVSVSQVNLRYDNSQFASIIADDLVITNAGIKYQVTAPLWIGVSYTVAKDTVNTANSSSTIGIAANYELSKRTSLYALAGTTSNSGASAMTPLYGASATGTAGVDNTAYAVGLRHIF